MEPLVPLLMLLLGVMCIGGVIAMIALKRKLKREHHDVYERFSSSGLQIVNDLNFARFLLSGSYALSVGPGMKRRMDAMRFFVIAYIFVFGAALLGIVVP